MNYRIMEHPKGNFIPQLSKDSGLTWESLICYKYTKEWKINLSPGLVECWGEPKYRKALETVENHKRSIEEYKVKRVVYQE